MIEKVRLYAGTEDFVNFFAEIDEKLGLNLCYDVECVDGEMEIVIYRVKKEDPHVTIAKALLQLQEEGMI